MILPFLINFNIRHEKVINTWTTLELATINLLLIRCLAITLRGLMRTLERKDSEKLQKTTMAIIGLIVIVILFMESPFYFLLLIEATVLPIAYLVMISSKGKDKIDSVKFMVIINTAGSVPFMMISGYLLKEGESLDLMRQIRTDKGIIIFIILFLIKTPIFLTHIWLTKVHVSAAGYCSMILARIIIKIGTVGIFKFYLNFSKEFIFYFLTALRMVGAIYITLYITRFFDSKTLIAISSVLHIAVIIPIIMIKKSINMLASVIIIRAHGVVSYYLFYLITLKYEKVERRTSILVKSIESYGKIFLLVMVTFMFLNIGIPPFIRFFSETIIFTSIEILASRTAKILMGTIILLSILFTMQINTNLAYKKEEKFVLKDQNISFATKSIFFIIWCLVVLWIM